MRFVSKMQVKKGWSEDKKYCVQEEDGTKYLLRVSSVRRASKLHEMAFWQKKIAGLGIETCNIIEVGSNNEEAYVLQEWIDGEDAEDIIPLLPDSRQYAYGLEAGQMIKKIHSVPAPDTLKNWEDRFAEKMDKKIKGYRECPIQFEGAEEMISYLEANKYLLRNRPQCFQHGDYHIGNMMISGGKLVIIDFDRFDFGDPWEEFNRIVWDVDASPIFASGIVNGYFDSQVSMDFWRLLALYICSNTLGSIPWAVSYGEQELQTQLKLAKKVLQWYNGMKNPMPGWYFSGY